MGVAGELYIGGAGVARGYLNRPELTAERFVPDPFSEEPGRGCTGRGIWCAGGRTGRWSSWAGVDEQVKIRGFRIEPGEIEAALARAPGGARGGGGGAGGGRRRASGWWPMWCRRQAKGPSCAICCGPICAAACPSTWCRRQIVFLPALPLSANGKLDRRALPEPEAGDLFQEYVPPRSEAEQRLAAIWSALLGVERVGVADNFFALGGDSIISIQMVSRAAREGLALTVRQVFEHQTLGALAQVAGHSAAQAVAEQGLVRGEARLTPILRWFFDQAAAERHHFNQSVLLEVSAELSAERLEAALRRLAWQHDALRLRFDAVAGGWQAVHAAGEAESFPLEAIDLASAEEQAAVAERVQSSLDLSRGPLARAALLRLPGQAARLLLVIHHLVVDGVSWRILLEDLAHLLGSAEATLPAKTTAFREWSERLAGWAESAAAQEEAAWWLAELARPWAVLPRDGSVTAGAGTVGTQATVMVSLGASETRALLQQVPEAYRTEINDILLAALCQSLGEALGEASAGDRVGGARARGGGRGG